MRESRDPAMTVMLAVSDATRLAGMASRALRSERARMLSSESMLKRSRADSLRLASDERALATLIARLVPLFGKGLASRHQRIAVTHDEAAEAQLADMEKGRSRIREVEAMMAVLDKSEASLTKAIRAIPSLGLPPKAVETRAIAISGICNSLLRARRGMDWSKRSADACRDCVGLVKDWARQRMAIVAGQQASTPTLAAPAVAPNRPARRIYLPIPSVMGSSARELGANRDDVAGRGISPWYVTTEMDLKPFRNLLPLAYRPEPTRFTFPPVPYRASGQNLWSFFDKDTWRRFRTAASDSTGGRCIICGGRGGFIADRVLGENERRHGVDCHEVWDWQVEDPATGIGVQSLKRLLVVCPSCHATFHSGYFTKRAADVGLADEVQDHIAKRRMLINRMGMDELQASLDASKQTLLAVQGVDKWIIDLEHIGRQQFATDHVPTMNERNDAGVPPERIAGIAFETESGERFPARSAAEIYMELSELEAEYSNLAGQRRI